MHLGRLVYVARQSVQHFIGRVAFLARRWPVRARAIAALSVFVFTGGVGLSIAVNRASQPYEGSGLEIAGVSFALDYGSLPATRLFPLVFDKDKALVGVFSPAMLGLKDPPPYLAVPCPNPPERWWRMVILLEDANIDAVYHVGGIDVAQLVLAGLRFITFQSGSGASTLVMQLIKSMKADTERKGLPKAIRKVRDILHAPVLHYALERAGPDALRSWYATHAPLLRSNLHGLELASWTLFDRPASELTLVQQAIFAAAPKRRLHPYRPLGWKAIKDRAQLALDMLFADGGLTREEHAAATGELAGMAYPSARVPEPCLQRQYAYVLREDGTRLDKRAIMLAQAELIEIRQEMLNAFGAGWWRDIEEIQLTFPVLSACRTRDAVLHTFRSVVEEMGRDQEARHVPPSERIDPGASYLALAVADSSGRIVDFVVTSTAYPYYGGYAFGEKGEFQPYDPQRETRTVGSIGKLLVAVIAGWEGDLAERPTYFARRHVRSVGTGPGAYTRTIRNVTGAEGFEAGDARGWTTPSRAFGTSNTLALIERLQRSPLSESGLLTTIHNFGFRPPRNQSRDSLVVDIPAGNLLGSPRTMHTAIRAIALAIDGGTPVPCAPRFVEKVRRRKPDGQLVVAEFPTKEVSTCRDVARYFENEGTATFVKATLSHVLDASIPGTAASALGSFTPAREPAIEWHIAKTGSTNSRPRRDANDTPPTAEASLVGALRTRGETYTYTLQVGATGGRRDLGPFVYGGTVAKVLRPVLAAILAREPGGAPSPVETR